MGTDASIDGHYINVRTTSASVYLALKSLTSQSAATVCNNPKASTGNCKTRRHKRSVTSTESTFWWLVAGYCSCSFRMIASGGYACLFTCNTGGTEENLVMFKLVHPQTRYHCLLLRNKQKKKLHGLSPQANYTD
jgi:hypothetical protein